MIKIIKESFSISLGRNTVLNEKLSFDKDVEQSYVNSGYAEFVVEKQTKERKRTIKTK